MYVTARGKRPGVAACAMSGLHAALDVSKLDPPGAAPSPPAAAAAAAYVFLLSTLCGASQVAIDNKIEQAMDLVKSHLMYAVREEVLVLKEQIQELRDKNSQLEYENNILKGAASQETLAKLAKGPPPPYTEPNPPPPASTS